MATPTGNLTERRPTRQINLGDVSVGGGAPWWKAFLVSSRCCLCGRPVPESADLPPLLDHLLLAFNGPVDAASEDEYGRWYDEEHIPEVLKINGMRAMERCRVINGRGIEQPFVLVHRIETDDVPALMKAMAGTGAAPLAMDRARSAFLLAEAVGDYSAPEGAAAQ